MQVKDSQSEVDKYQIMEQLDSLTYKIKQQLKSKKKWYEMKLQV